jgi:hypothetical protein
MKSISFFRLCFVITTAIITLISPDASRCQSKFKVGTYDSRAVATAYFQSPYNIKVMKIFNDLHSQMQKAQEEHDSIKISKLNFEAPTRQAMLHEKGFGTGSVRYELLEIKDKIDSLAKAEKLDLILSKWELNYSSSNCEVVDISEKIGLLFNPNERFRNIIKEILKSEPIKDAYLIED